MFKLRKVSKRTINATQALAQINCNNIQNYKSMHQNPLTPNLMNTKSNLFHNKSRIYKRSSTTKLNEQNVVKVQSRQSTQENIFSSRTTKVVSDKLNQRTKLEKEIRTICKNQHAEKLKELGGRKQEFILKMIEKSLVSRREQTCLQSMIQRQLVKMDDVRVYQQRYQKTVGKIEQMLQMRLLQLDSYRG